jgi:hypothetical protein
VPYDDPLMTWMLDELEDNVIFSWQSGYNLEDYEETWFKKGGVTLQPCLLDMPSAYIARDEIPAALRAFWNTYAMSIYPDATCFAEWVREFGRPGGPLYKTSDESRFVIWLRQLLVWEDHPAWDGSALWLARGAPRAWLGDGERIEVRNAPVFTGAVSYVIESHVDRGVIEAEVELHGPEARGAVYLRLRHPNGPATPERVLVNGMPLDPARIEGEDILLKRPDDAAGASYSVRALYDRP